MIVYPIESHGIYGFIFQHNLGYIFWLQEFKKAAFREKGECIKYVGKINSISDDFISVSRFYGTNKLTIETE